MNNILSSEYRIAIVNETAEKVLETPFVVRPEKRYGKDVFVSVVAEAARKAHCCCIREVNGRQETCQRLQNNLLLEKRLTEENGEAIAMATLKDMASAVFDEMTMYGTVKMDDPRIDSACPIALVNYALCVCGSIANAVAVCPHYLSPNEEPKAA